VSCKRIQLAIATLVVVLKEKPMTRLNAVDLIRTRGSLFLQCPHCRGHNLDCPETPRGDDAVACRTCSNWFSYAELEQQSLSSTRKLLSVDFPELFE
jgi:hypothetical protein